MKITRIDNKTALLEIVNRGPAGPQGLKGDAGEGVAGPIGPVGPAGAQGPTGTVGARGATGATGSAGAQGVAGPQGLKGDTGPAGATGSQGPVGLTGAAGPKGDSIKGDKGDSIVGPPGRDGIDGQSIVGPPGATTTMLPVRPFSGSLVALNGLTVTPTPTAVTGAADQLDIYPYVPSYNLSIDQLSITTTNPVAGSSLKIVIYGADSDGLPLNLLFESDPRPTIATGVDQPVTASFSFVSGKLYWIGVRYSAGQAIRAIGAVSWPHFARSGTTYYNSFRRTVAYADAAPAVFNPVSSEMTAAALPVICGRRA